MSTIISALSKLRIKKKSLYESWVPDIKKKGASSSVCKDGVAMSELIQEDKLDEVAVNGNIDSLIYIKELEIVTPPSKTEYVDGEAFDATGMVVNANISDGGVMENVTGYSVSPETLTADITEVTISFSFGDETVTTVCPVTVTANA